jgi:hypothetical protein
MESLSIPNIFQQCIIHKCKDFNMPDFLKLNECEILDFLSDPFEYEFEGEKNKYKRIYITSSLLFVEKCKDIEDFETFKKIMLKILPCISKNFYLFFDSFLESLSYVLTLCYDCIYASQVTSSFANDQTTCLKMKWLVTLLPNIKDFLSFCRTYLHHSEEECNIIKQLIFNIQKVNQKRTTRLESESNAWYINTFSINNHINTNVNKFVKDLIKEYSIDVKTKLFE